MANDCFSPGDANSDIAGLGITIAFAVQAVLAIAFSLVAHPAWEFLMLKGYDESLDYSGSPVQLKLKSLNHMVDLICAIQSLTGIALIIAALSQGDELSLYHYHIVYDVVSFTGVSYLASLFHLWSPHIKELQLDDTQEFLSWTCTVLSWLTSRFISYILFGALYVVFFAKFIAKLSRWNNAIAGLCHHTDGVTRANASHPHDDVVYVCITFASMLLAFLGCFVLTGASDRLTDRLGAMDLANYEPSVVITNIVNQPAWRFRLHLVKTWLFTFLYYTVALLDILLYTLMFVSPIGQFTVHLYMAVSLRHANQAYLDESEDEWGFGQVLAVVLLFPLVIEGGQELVRYQANKRKWEDEVAAGTLDPFGRKLETISLQTLEKSKVLTTKLAAIERRKRPYEQHASDVDAALALVQRLRNGNC